MSVWKRLQRVGKSASKFQFTASYQELEVESSKKWWVFQDKHLIGISLAWNFSNHYSKTLLMFVK